MESSSNYALEDWLVHVFFGIGQIKDREVKSISGANIQYFRIQTADSTFWIPVDRMNGEELRPLSTSEEIQLAIAVLLRPPKEMSSDHKMRKNDIRRVQLENAVENMARLIRDLRGRQREKGELNMEERNALRSLKQRLIEEWSIATGENSDRVTARLDDLLN